MRSRSLNVCLSVLIGLGFLVAASGFLTPAYQGASARVAGDLAADPVIKWVSADVPRDQISRAIISGGAIFDVNGMQLHAMVVKADSGNQPPEGCNWEFRFINPGGWVEERVLVAACHLTQFLKFIADGGEPTGGPRWAP